MKNHHDNWDLAMKNEKELKGENAELKEGHSLIYQSLRSAEGIKELMTGSEFECIAESVKSYIQGFHEMEDEIDELKEENDEWREVCDDFDTPDEVRLMIDDMKEEIMEYQCK